VANPRFILARNTFPDLKDNHAAGLREEWGHFGELKVNDKEYGFCFKFHEKRSGVILLRNLDESVDRKGSRVHGAWVDELTETSQKSYGRLKYQCTAPGPFNCVVGLTNPDGPYYSWVMEGWKADDPNAGERGWWKDETSWKLYVPFLPTDNPIWEQMKEAFMASIADLPEAVRRGRLLGIWGAPEGARFPWMSKHTHTFRREDLPFGIEKKWLLFLGIDYGQASPFAGIKLAVDLEEKRIYAYGERYGAKVPAKRQAMSLRSFLEEGETFRGIYAEPAMWQKQTGHDGTILATPAEVYQGEFEGEPRLKAGLDKGQLITDRTFVMQFIEELTRVREDGRPFLLIDAEACPNLWKELVGAVYAEKDKTKRVGDIDPRNPDHAITAVWYGIPQWVLADLTKQAPTEEEIHKKALEQRMRRMAKKMFGSAA
jgi:hypothetical protein